MSSKKDNLAAKMYGVSSNYWSMLKDLLDSIAILDDIDPVKEKLRLSMFANPNLEIGTDIVVKATFVQDVNKFIGHQSNCDRHILYKNCYKHIAKMDLVLLKKLPEVGEKVLVMHYSKVCRAIVLNRLDSETVKIYFIDHGLCQNANKTTLFEYDQPLNQYPPFAIGFRIHGIQPVKPNDVDVIQGMDKLLLPQKLSAKIVGINQLEENEFEVEADFWDVNGLNIAITLIRSKLARVC